MNISMGESRNILVTGGRAPVTLELARIFAQEGHEVFVADSFTAQLAKSSNHVKQGLHIHSPVQNFEAFITDLVDIIKTKNIHQLIPTCEEIFYIAKGKKKLEKYCDVFCTDLSFLLKLHNKYEFTKLVVAQGLEAPPSYLAYSAEEVHEQYKEITGEAILKPTYSRFGSKVLFLQRETLSDLKLAKGEYVVQKRIIGDPICSYSVFRNGDLVVHTQYKVVYTAGNSAAIQFQHTEHKKVENWVREFFSGKKITGQFAFDFIETATGKILPLECNPRATSGVHLFTGLPFASRLLGKEKDLLMPSTKTNRMIMLAMILYGWRKQDKGKWLTTLLQSQDVVWSQKDKKPFFYQFYTYYTILKQSFRMRKSPLETTTADIEWNGDQL